MEINFEANQYEFLSILKSINRNGADIDALIYKLTNSDFFTAPYTATKHLSIMGGLCQHSLDIYRNLKWLSDKYLGEKVSDDTIKIVGLLSCVANMNKFESTTKNVKEYKENGKLSDDLGRFSWKTVKGYRVKDDHFAYGHFGQNSEYIVGTYIPLTFEESVCITNQKYDTSEEYQPFDINLIYEKYPLVSLLFVANFLSTSMDEREFK